VTATLAPLSSPSLASPPLPDHRQDRQDGGLAQPALAVGELGEGQALLDADGEIPTKALVSLQTLAIGYGIGIVLAALLTTLAIGPHGC
jgi:hypothetical protein